MHRVHRVVSGAEVQASRTNTAPAPAAEARDAAEAER